MTCIKFGFKKNKKNSIIVGVCVGYHKFHMTYN